MFLIFDTETTGLPQDYAAPVTDLDNWPRLVQLAWQLHDHTGKYISSGNYIVRPDGFTIPFNAEKIHGISTDRALKEGRELKEVLQDFLIDLGRATYFVGHNVGFDQKIMGAEFIRARMSSPLMEMDMSGVS